MHFSNLDISSGLPPLLPSTWDDTCHRKSLRLIHCIWKLPAENATLKIISRVVLKAAHLTTN